MSSSFSPISIYFHFKRFVYGEKKNICRKKKGSVRRKIRVDELNWDNVEIRFSYAVSNGKSSWLLLLYFVVRECNG